jgi:hypothetical protein
MKPPESPGSKAATHAKSGLFHVAEPAITTPPRRLHHGEYDQTEEALAKAGQGKNRGEPPMRIFDAITDFIADVINFFIAALDSFLSIFGINI